MPIIIAFLHYNVEIFAMNLKALHINIAIGKCKHEKVVIFLGNRSKIVSLCPNELRCTSMCGVHLDNKYASAYLKEANDVVRLELYYKLHKNNNAYYI